MPTDMKLLELTLKQMKNMYEDAIKSRKYINLIRSQKLSAILYYRPINFINLLTL